MIFHSNDVKKLILETYLTVVKLRELVNMLPYTNTIV